MRTPLTAKPIIYADFFADLRQTATLSDIARQTNEDSVKAAIRHLLQTDRGERLMQPELGSDIRRMLFENFSAQTLTILRDYIEDTITQYEPRANLIDIQVSGIPDQNAINVQIVFSVINNERPVTLTLIVDRIR